MEVLSALVALLPFWRTVVVAAAFGGLALVISVIVPVLPGEAGIVITLVGVGIGLIWDARAFEAANVKHGTHESHISWPVAALGLWFFGAVVGGLCMAWTGSTLIAAVLLVTGVMVAFVWRRRGTGIRPSIGAHVLAGVALLLGLATVIGAAALQATPNPSLKRSANGMPPGPRYSAGMHYLQRGPGVMPSSPA